MHDVAQRYLQFPIRFRRSVRVWIVLQAVCLPARLLAEPTCAAAVVRVESRLPSKWDLALQHACAHFSTAREVDLAVTIHVRFFAPEVVLVASRSDGRSTVRAVRQPSELLTTLEALVMMPPEAAVELQSTAAVARAARADLRSANHAASELRAAPSRRNPIHVEFGAELSSRVAWSPVYLSPALGLHVGFRTDAWMFGIDARTEPYQFPLGEPPAGFEMDGFGAGVFIARRLFDGGVGLDLGARGFLGVENQALEANELANQASELDARVGVMSRLLFGVSSPRWTLGLDAELSPMRLRREFKIYQYLPGVSVGLGFGIALESP